MIPISVFFLTALAADYPPGAPIHSIPSPTGIAALFSAFNGDYSQAPSHPTDKYPFSEEEEEYQEDDEPDDEEDDEEENSSRGHQDWLNEVMAGAEELISRSADYTSAVKRFRLASVLGHEGAAATAGALLLAADGTLKRNIPAAVASLRRAAEGGQADAHALLGVLHASGLADRHGVQKSHERALSHWEVAALAGNVYASSALGFRYMYGIGVSKNCQQAARFYRKAAFAIATDARYWPTPHNFEHGEAPLASSLVSVGRTRLSEDSFDRTVRLNPEDLDLFYYYRHSAEGGDTNSMTLIGSLLLTGGLGMEANVNEARNHLRRAADEGHGEAHGLMGHLALRQSNYSGAINHFRRSAATGDRIGHYGLGMIFLHGLAGEKKDLAKAAMHFRFAAESKHADASFQLAMLYWHGSGVKQDAKTAYKLFQKAAELGSIQSKLNLGIILLDGKHPVTQSDCPRALRYFKEVAEEGEWGTLFDLALGAFDRRDLFGSLYRHTQAAHAGIELGQFNAAMILEMAKADEIPELDHWGRDRRIAELHELYGMSGRQGKPESYIRSGDVAYLESKDFIRAARAYNMSYRLNDAEGTFSLAMMYANGIGVVEDRDQAIGYLETVSEMDSSPALAANLAILGLRLYWWAGDVIEWWKELQRTHEEGAGLVAGGATTHAGALASGGRRSASATNKVVSTIGDDLALVGGLLVVLIAVLVARSKRMARVPSEDVDYGHRNEDGSR